jgi:cytidyltransferase-like protein
MKNYIAKADKKTSSNDRQYSMFVGRWQPLHVGHQWLFNQALEEGKNVLICIRDVKPDDKNPFTPDEVKKNIEDHYGELITEERVKVIIIPDIESINYGRGVGYDVIEHVPPKDIHDISATKLREQMKKEGKL